MSAFNRRYAALRQEARARGGNVLPYPAALDRLRRQLFRHAAGVRINATTIDAALAVAPKAQT